MKPTLISSTDTSYPARLRERLFYMTYPGIRESVTPELGALMRRLVI